MKATELRELTVKELEERLDNERGILMKQKLNHAISPLDNPNKISDTKKNIARILTILSQKEGSEKTNDK